MRGELRGRVQPRSLSQSECANWCQAAAAKAGCTGPCIRFRFGSQLSVAALTAAMPSFTGMRNHSRYWEMFYCLC